MAGIEGWFCLLARTFWEEVEDFASSQESNSSSGLDCYSDFPAQIKDFPFLLVSGI